MRGKKLHFSLVTFQLALDLSSRCDKQNHRINKAGKDLQDHQIQRLSMAMPITPYHLLQDTFHHSVKFLGCWRPWRSYQQVRYINLHIRDQWGAPADKLWNPRMVWVGWDPDPHGWGGTAGKPEGERSQEAKEDVSSALTMPWCAGVSRILSFLPLEGKDELKEETEQLLDSWRHSFDENE